MKRKLIASYIFAVALLILPTIVFAGSATISWNANTDSDLTGYRIYYGTTKGGPYGSSTALIPKAQTSYIVPNLSSGTYYFVVVALDTADNESIYSSEVSKTIASTTASTTTSASTPATAASTATTATKPATTASAPTSTTAASAASSASAAADKASTSSSGSTSSSTGGAVVTSIPLPASGIYGQVSGNASQLKKVDFSFSGKQGKVKIYYKGYDVDSSIEVGIIINGTLAGYAKKTKNNKWGKKRSITLNAKYVKNSSSNILTFQSNYSSPDTDPWGVQIINIK